MTPQTKTKIRIALIGKPKSKEHARKAGLASGISRKKNGSQVAEKNSAWRGDNVGYRALHHWVERHLGTPRHCAVCHSTDKNRYHWANVSHSYKRELSDWVRLCAKCHVGYDLGRIKL